MIRVGDVFEIPLANGYKAYGQYIIESQMGQIIQIFDLMTKDEAEIEHLKNAGQLFPPVITGLTAAT